MITPLSAKNLAVIHNPVLAEYARRYIDLAQDYASQVLQTGIQFASTSSVQENDTKKKKLADSGVWFRNGGKSIVLNRISPACEACQTGVGSATFIISLRCHRNCFYCFNPNQEDYEYHLEHQGDPALDLERIHASRKGLTTIALTGGEPLLFKEETYRFFRTARRLFPKSHTRLYTSGDHADEATLRELRDAGLDEIRFSIRIYDLEKGQRHTFERIRLARDYIPQVMVEMPVLPGSYEVMKDVLLELDSLQIHSINLLEFCYPLWNAEEFARRGYTIKNPPHRILYDYWYAGGLPVQGSEDVCLDLVAFALERQLKLGVHYCSLENKHTGQIYQQNKVANLPKLYEFSEKDYFLKSAKVFGSDISVVQSLFKRKGYFDAVYNEEYDYLEFPLRKIYSLRNLKDVEVVIAYHVVEKRGSETILREVHLGVTTPQLFDGDEDI